MTPYLTASPRLASEQIMVCPFCRAKDPIDDKEVLKRLWEQIDEYNDPKAMQILGVLYMEREHGLSKNLKKAEELYQHVYDLGDSFAANYLAELYTKHIPDQAHTMKYFEKGVKRGNALSMVNLGVRAGISGNHEEAKQQFILLRILVMIW